MTILKSAVIGCGRIGCEFDYNSNSEIIRTHSKFYHKNPKTSLIALCDIDKQKLKKFGQYYKVLHIYDNPDKLFSKENIDCVSICTKVDNHLSLVKKAANNNVRGIFLEKPMTISLHSAKQIIQICKQKNIILGINHQRHYDPFYNKISKFLHKQRFGKIKHVQLFYGGGIANTGSHMFDILRFFFGEVKKLKVNSYPVISNNSDPNLAITIEFKNNIYCNMQPVIPENYGIAEMDIFGTKGRLIINLVSNFTQSFILNKSTGTDYGDLKKFVLPFKALKPATDISFALQNFINSVINQKEPKCTGTDGYKSLELIIASLLSFKTKKEQQIPLRKNNYRITSK